MVSARRVASVAAFVVLALQIVSARGIFVALPNMYSPGEDVQLGRDATEVMRGQMPLQKDTTVANAINEIGNRLVGELPAELRQPLFHYSFDVVNIEDVGGMAFPGGPIFVTRGMIETARTEGQLAGVLAHLIAHVAMRHATMQASAHLRFQIGEITGQEIGFAAAGIVDGVLSQASTFAVTSYFLTYGEEAERQADVLSARLLAGAGYDPMEIIAIFNLIANDEAGRGSEFTFGHPPFGLKPDSTNRDAVIKEELQTLHVEPVQRSDAFQVARTRLAQLPVDRKPRFSVRAATAAGAAAIGFGVVAPSGDWRIATADDLLDLSVPENWERIPAGNAVAFAPDRAFLAVTNGPVTFTHGIVIGVARNVSGDLTRNLRSVLLALSRASPKLQWSPAVQQITLAGRPGITTTMNNVSPVSASFEQVTLSVALLPDDSLLYVVSSAPQHDASTYRNVFDRVIESIQIVQ